MAIFRCSMFGHIVYDDKLTYQELLDTEARVTALMQNEVLAYLGCWVWLTLAIRN